jgi:hypothetical protein
VRPLDGLFQLARVELRSRFPAKSSQAVQTRVYDLHMVNPPSIGLDGLGERLSIADGPPDQFSISAFCPKGVSGCPDAYGQTMFGKGFFHKATGVAITITSIAYRDDPVFLVLNQVVSHNLPGLIIGSVKLGRTDICVVRAGHEKMHMDVNEAGDHCEVREIHILDLGRIIGPDGRNRCNASLPYLQQDAPNGGPPCPVDQRSRSYKKRSAQITCLLAFLKSCRFESPI